MATFRYGVEIGDFVGERFEPIDALVETGATYTFIPGDLLGRLDITPQQERTFVPANGQEVCYGMAWVRIRLDGREEPTIAIFGEPGSEALLGAFTLEGFGLGVDSVNRRLIPTPGYLVSVSDRAGSRS